MKTVFLLVMVLFSQFLFGNVTWRSPVTISSSGVNASSQQIAMDGNGNAVGIWVENGNIRTRSLPLNGVWGTVTTLSNTGLASSPQIVSDPSGHVTAVWLEGSIVNWANATTTGGWTVNGALSGSGVSSPKIAVDVAGDVVVVWALGGFIQSKTRRFGFSFPATADTISLAGSDSPHVSIGANGMVVAVWHEVMGTVDTIFAATKPINGGWRASALISDPSVNSINPHIAVDPNGKAEAVWFRFDVSGTTYSDVIVQNSTLPFGGSWSTPVDISLAGIYNPLDLQLKIAFDNSGNAAAVWTTSQDGVTFDVQASVKPGLNNGIIGIDQANTSQVFNSWITPITINNNNLYGFAFDFSVDSNGEGFVVFMNFNTAHSTLVNDSVEIQTSAYTLGFLTTTVQFSTGTKNGFPKVTSNLISNTHNLVALWIDNNGTNNIIQASTGTANAIQPPTSLSITQGQTSFGVFTEKFNQLNWHAGGSPNISKYLIFRNGTFVQSVPNNTLQYIDNNRLIGEIDTYGVAAVDNTGLQSAVVFITAPAVH